MGMSSRSRRRLTGTTRRARSCIDGSPPFPRPPLSSDEARTLEAIADRIVPQPDRAEDRKVPIVPWIDEKLFTTGATAIATRSFRPCASLAARHRGHRRVCAFALHGRPFASSSGFRRMRCSPASSVATRRGPPGAAPGVTIFPRRPAAQRSLGSTTRTRSRGTRSVTVARRRRAAMFATGWGASIRGTPRTRTAREREARSLLSPRDPWRAGRHARPVARRSRLLHRRRRRRRRRARREARRGRASPSSCSMPARTGIPRVTSSPTRSDRAASSGPTNVSPAGDDPVELGSNNSGRGVGGSTVHYSMVAMRAHPEDFGGGRSKGRSPAPSSATGHSRSMISSRTTKRSKGAPDRGADGLPVGAAAKTLPAARARAQRLGRVLVYGCTRARNSRRAGPGRDAQRAVARPATVRLPRVLQLWVHDEREELDSGDVYPAGDRGPAPKCARCMAAKVEHDARGRVTGVLHFRDGNDVALHFQRARNVVVAGYAIETPRLLLNSSSALFPDGLANSSGWSGSASWCTPGHQVFARFRRGSTSTRRRRRVARSPSTSTGRCRSEDFVCGYTIEVVGPHPHGLRRAGELGARPVGRTTFGASCSTTTTTPASASSGRCFRSGKTA